MEIRGVVFDMDGVLIDAREWHYLALNSALDLFGYKIEYEDHILRFDGLPTRVKLDFLSAEEGLPKHLHKLINDIKQERTLRLAASQCYPKSNHLSILTYLKANGFRIGLATNSIRETTVAMMTYAGLIDFFDSILTNEDVSKPKPNPEIYLKSAKNLGLEAHQILVFEDNQHGIRAAKDAGCHVSSVDSPDTLYLDTVLEILES